MNPEVKTKPRQSRNERARSRGRPTVLRVGPDGIISPFVTHWSRIFYYDLFTGDRGATATHPDGVTNRSRQPARDGATRRLHGNQVETLVTPKDTDHDDWVPRFKTPIEAAAILLGVYIAIYLTVAGIVHVLGSPDATAAAARDAWTAAHSAAPIAAPDSPQRESLSEESERSTDSDVARHDHAD